MIYVCKMYYWCIVDMLKIATHVYTTIPTYIKNTFFRNYIVSTMHIKKQTFRHSLTKNSSYQNLNLNNRVIV